jgi:hypothetical protein
MKNAAAYSTSSLHQTCLTPLSLLPLLLLLLPLLRCAQFDVQRVTDTDTTCASTIALHTVRCAESEGLSKSSSSVEERARSRHYLWTPAQRSESNQAQNALANRLSQV